MIIYFPRIPKYIIYPALVVIVSIPFILLSVVYNTPQHQYHLFAIAGVILFQIYMSRKSFNTCGTCGHERHMHDKKDLVRKNFTGLAKVVCDNFRKGKCERNYERKYWNGEDTIEKWDQNRDR